MVTVVMSDGSTFRMPSAVRIVGDTLQLERDPHNHPIFLVLLRMPAALSPLQLPSCICPPSHSPRALPWTQGEGDGTGMLNKREAARLQRIKEREQRRGIGMSPSS
eukprot:scaffold240919_cov39-Tisochrysis_lutea.AAC.2